MECNTLQFLVARRSLWVTFKDKNNGHTSLSSIGFLLLSKIKTSSSILARAFPQKLAGIKCFALVWSVLILERLSLPSQNTLSFFFQDVTEDCTNYKVGKPGWNQLLSLYYSQNTKQFPTIRVISLFITKSWSKVSSFRARTLNSSHIQRINDFHNL